MAKTCLVVLLVALAGCAAVPQGQYSVSACNGAEASYACQVERYHNVAQ
jgi:hypothetical protein